ncbi:hypothetical protein NDN08_005924 [Rhodosorus marinus]|uniref:Subtilisin n=1 Tax=Rhodosorus marinus TaxID=101924 RepID=A0AAV8UDX6_9RHOD|nr:hypothetical protein NDN08_005924 [Rhodosorus marinus]
MKTLYTTTGFLAVGFWLAIVTVESGDCAANILSFKSRIRVLTTGGGNQPPGNIQYVAEMYTGTGNVPNGKTKFPIILDAEDIDQDNPVFDIPVNEMPILNYLSQDFICMVGAFRGFAMVRRGTSGFP